MGRSCRKRTAANETRRMGRLPRRDPCRVAPWQGTCPAASLRGIMADLDFWPSPPPRTMRYALLLAAAALLVLIGGLLAAVLRARPEAGPSGAPPKAQRIVSMAPSITETLYAL